MELGRALQYSPCFTCARIRVVYGHRWSCGSYFSSGGTTASASRLRSLFMGESDRTSSRLFDLHVFLHPDENVPHLGDIVLHQMLVKRVGNLQPTDECSGEYIFIVVVHRSHLLMEIVDVALKALLWFHSDREEMVAVFLELFLRSELIVENVSYIIETLKRVLRE